MEQYLISGAGLIVPSTVDFHGREIKSGSLWTIRLEESLHTNTVARMLST